MKHLKKIKERLSNRPIFTLSKSMSRKIAEEQSLVEDFIKTTDVPPWYRGKSNFQRDAANNLFNAIRDDSEQRTAHRVRGCLNLIGVNPMVSDKELKFLMKLSMGNDLAFLWFLMEMHYLSPGNSYNINEQLILSTIAHLDMITTLRRLDHILPPGHKSIKEMRRDAKLKAEKAEKKSRLRKHHAEMRREKRCSKNMPYFEPPVEIHKYGKTLESHPLDLKVKFLYYDNYKNPNFVVSNESNRWYATYQLQPQRRIVGHVVNERIKSVFELDLEYIQSDIVLHGINTLFDKEGNNMRRSATPMSMVLCTHHRNEYLAKELKKHQRALDMKQRCMKQLDVHGYKQMQRIKKMLAHLEERMTKHLLEVRARQRPEKNKTRVILIQDGFHCSEVLVDESEVDCKQDPQKRPSKGKKRRSHEKKKRSLTRKSIDPCPDNDFKRGDFIMEHICTKADCNNSMMFIREKKPPPKVVKQLALCCKSHPLSETDLQFYRNKRLTNIAGAAMDELQDEVAARAVTSKQYFTSNTATKPYRFHYEEIYRYNFDDNSNTNQNGRSESIVASSYRRQKRSTTSTIVINNNSKNCKSNLETSINDPLKRKKLYIDALNYKEKNVPKMFDDTPDLMGAIQNDVYGTWKERVAIKSKKMEEMWKAEQVRNIGKVKLDIPQQKYYDCDDRTLMLRMLKVALEEMSKDPKYVLASLKDAYKLPILYEWITQRYGKRYTHKECMHSFSLSIKIFSALEKMDVLKMSVPTTKDLGQHLFSDYSCRNYLVKKAESIKQRFNERVNEATMAQTRIFWFAMRPYLCPKGPPRNTFFAYMPPRTRNIHHFRQWTPTEYIDMRGLWEQRQRAIRANNIFRY